MSCQHYKNGQCHCVLKFPGHTPHLVGRPVCASCEFNTNKANFPQKSAAKPLPAPIMPTRNKLPMDQKPPRPAVEIELRNIIESTAEGNEPLIGDRLAAWIDKHGPDLAFTVMKAKRGFPCEGCKWRKEWLNRIHQTGLKMLGILRGGG